MTNSKTVYSVETLRAGQPRAYADTVHEYLITVTATTYGKDGLQPRLMYGDVEKQIKEEEAQRAAGTMSGGMNPENLRKRQGDWARNIVRSLCHSFREKGDDDGRTDAEAYFYPTLQSLKLDPKAGTIRAVIVSPYTG